MKKMLFVVALALVGSVFAADLSKNLTFEADYRTGSTTPQVAKGFADFEKRAGFAVDDRNGDA